MKRLFIFDWDGTLCDSTAGIIAAVHAAARDVSLPELEDAQVMDIIGLGLAEALHKLYPGLSPGQLEQMRDAYRDHYLAGEREAPKLFPGVENTLSALRAEGHLVAVATGKGRAGLQRVLQSLDAEDWFHASRCADETASKPDPLMLCELLQELRMTAEQAVMIGDTEYDMEMAQRVNMQRVAVDYGAHCVSRLRKYGPVLTISRVEELLPNLAIHIP